ncbi:MAG: Ig-like domain-containing protein [Candidatus Sericytochromatia bacterium]|nr:Ig-like domain-containing protein [Candidatus Sericytochromatia bacterium]
MASNKKLTSVFAVAATLSVAVLAGCPATNPVATPSTRPSGSVSATPTGTPTVTPTGMPTGTGSGTPSGAPSATPTPSTLPSTPDTSSRATIQGVVFDDLGSRLDGVTVTGKLLGAGTFSNGSDTLVVTTQIGSYALNGAPTGSTILVTAGKAGFTTRQQTIVPLSNLQGNTTINNVTFGQTAAGVIDLVYALSDKPEITSFTPAKDATGVDAATTFTLTFNEPVNTADVESNFAVYVAGPRSDVATAAAMTNPNTAVQGRYTTGASNTALLYTFDPNKDDGSVNGTRSNVRFAAGPVYDSASFTPAWSNNNQTVTFTFRPGAKLPTDKDSSKIPQFAVSFKDGSIRDAAGTGRDDKWFRVSPAQVGRVGYKFTVATDTTSPQVSSITPINKDALAGAASTDRIRVQYSETMILFPGNNGGASIPAAADTATANLNTNYMYYVSPTGTTRYPDLAQVEGTGTNTAPGAWQATYAAFVAGGAGGSDGGGNGIAAGQKIFDGDATRSTMELQPVSGLEVAAPGAGSTQAFGTGRNVWVNAKSAIIDPAGNSVNTSNNINIRSGISQ